MSQENVEIVKRVIDAFNRRDLSAFAEISHEDFEFVSFLTAVDTGAATFRGRQAWTGYFAAMDETWEEWRVESAEVFDRAVVLYLVLNGLEDHAELCCGVLRSGTASELHPKGGPREVVLKVDSEEVAAEWEHRWRIPAASRRLLPS